MKKSLKQSGKRDSNPRPSAWEANALPLSYSRIMNIVVKDMNSAQIVNCKFIRATQKFQWWP